MNRLVVTALGAFAMLGCVASSPPRTAGVRRYMSLSETYSAAPSHPAPFATAFIFLPGATTRQAVRFQNVNGMAIYQGDIMLGPTHLVSAWYALPRFAYNPNIKGAVATNSPSHLWPGAVIPYEIDASVTPQNRELVLWAVAHVSAESVVTVRPRTPVDADYVVFTQTGDVHGGCASYVGKKGGTQEVWVGGCTVRGSVVHELGHAAGFRHEQSRSDRDNYVTINWQAISPGNEEQFEIVKDAVDIGGYDYGSIMHYSRRAFSKNGDDTIIVKDPNASIGNREGLSISDKAALAQLYAGSGPPTVGLPKVAPPKVAPPGTTPVVGFGGSYTSNRGNVSCSDLNTVVTCSFSGGSMTCVSQGSQLSCSWLGGGQGLAVFAQQANGDLRGSYGDLVSNNSRGAWDLVRTGGGAAAPPPGIPGFPGFPGLPPLPVLPPGFPTFPFPAALPLGR